MRIGFITTIDTNIGDDFIRTGIENIIDSILGKDNVTYTYVNKHLPETSFKEGFISSLFTKSPTFKGKGRLFKLYRKQYGYRDSVYNEQDLIIQSGAPVLWPNCHTNEWAQPIWYDTISKIKNRIPVINLAAGSCYPWENKETYTCEEEAKYASDIGGFCRLTVTRDKLANKLFASVGVKNTLLPCSAFFVDKEFSNSNSGEYVLVNYMRGGGHFEWGQGIDEKEWESAFLGTIKELAKNHEVRFICHNQAEVELAQKIAPEFQAFLPETVEEYLEIIRKAKVGINNRMHASVAMASVGVPSVSICTDTRLLMLENLGLPVFYVKGLTKDQLLKSTNDLISNFDEERKRLFELKKTSFEEYKKLLKEYVSKN